MDKEGLLHPRRSLLRATLICLLQHWLVLFGHMTLNNCHDHKYLLL
jgi:hypothetical protein